MPHQDEEIVSPEQSPKNNEEKTLLEIYKERRETHEILGRQLKAATEDLEIAEAKLIALLEDDGKSASAKYEDLGHVCIVEGAAYASIEKGRQEDVMDFVRKIGREDLIKTSIHSATLSTFVRELLKRNDPLPPGVTFYKPKTLRFYPSGNL